MSREFQIRHHVGRITRDRPRVPANSAPPEQNHGIQIQSEDDAEKKFWSKYYFEKVLGRGGSGVVALIRNKITGQQCACKMVDKTKVSPESLEALRCEPKWLIKLTACRFVINLVESFESTKRLFIVTEMMKGKDLNSFLAKRKADNSPLRESEVAVVMIILLRALRQVHSLKLVHGDIKPGRPTLLTSENLLLGEQGNLGSIKLGDFGVTRLAQETEKRVNFSQMQVGTPSYMAPEKVHENASQ